MFPKTIVFSAMPIGYAQKEDKKMQNSDFFTIRGYNMQNQGEITHTMEDYLEMICRNTKDGNFIRVNQLAALLNVKPSSASKMAGKLKESGMVDFEPYGVINLTQRGKDIGTYLLYRHDVLHRLFCKINASQNELELVEKVEHYFDSETIKNIEEFLSKL